MITNGEKWHYLTVKNLPGLLRVITSTHNRIDRLIEEKNGVKYLNISDTNKNSKVLKKYNEVFDGVKDCIKK